MTNIKNNSKKMYDKLGKDYQNARNTNKKCHNKYYEVPSMVRAVGNIKNKKLLDIGCGAGIHIKKYYAKGAKCKGMDLSQTMIDLAKKNCPKIDFMVGSMTDLKYPKSSFDIVTASLSVHYVKDLKKAFSEINKVLKKKGLFYFSTYSLFACHREKIDNSEFKGAGIGFLKNKKTNKELILGDYGFKEKISRYEVFPGMKIKNYFRSLGNLLSIIQKSNFELIDVIDCKTTLSFKKYDPKGYARLQKYPLFSIYVLRKK